MNETFVNSSSLTLQKLGWKQGDIPPLKSKTHQCSDWHTCWILKERFGRFSKFAAFVMSLHQIPVSSHNSHNHRSPLISHLQPVCATAQMTSRRYIHWCDKSLSNNVQMYDFERHPFVSLSCDAGWHWQQAADFSLWKREKWCSLYPRKTAIMCLVGFSENGFVVSPCVYDLSYDDVL